MMDRDEAIEALTESFKQILATPTYVSTLKRADETYLQFQAAKRIYPDGRVEVVILLDRPVMHLTDEQMARARTTFGDGPSSRDVQYEGRGDRWFKGVGWQLDYGTDPRAAAERAVEAFEAIFEPPPWPEYEALVFEGTAEGWEKL